MSEEYVFGKNIIENLTTGMYSDSKVIYREYIQNASDSIDNAVKIGLLNGNEAKIDIWFDVKNRNITIEDNATGILNKDFKRILGSIADSDKTKGVDKGFRGIGRLCGLAYCEKLIFTSKTKDEKVISIMEVDAKRMRDLIDSNKKMSANEVLNSVNKFSEKEEINELHYFKVEMININEENEELLDKEKIINYLSFVTPVPYQNTFTFRKKIYEFAKKENFKIDEYKISINGEQVFKKYSTDIGDDKIIDIELKKVEGYGGVVGWLWFGFCSFKKALPENVKMRGIRLRKENIQIGGEDALQKLFKESRGNHYFIGEVFATHQSLIPNSQRDYFNENITRRDFEGELKKYFDEELKKIYYNGSKINSAYDKIDKVAELTEIFNNRSFANENEKDKELKKIEDAKNKANEANKDLEKIKNNSIGSIKRLFEHIEQERAIVKKIEPNNRKKTIIERMNVTKNERKMLDKIFSIITEMSDKETSMKIIEKIQGTFK